MRQGQILRMGRRRVKRVICCATLVVASITSVTSRGATISSWLAPTSGSWSESAKWSTAQYPNNDSPPGTTYDALIDFSGAPGTNYTITVDRFLTLNSLTLN